MWMVIHSAGNTFTTARKLARQKVTVFLPLIWQKDRMIPLYGAYLFAEHAPEWPEWDFAGRVLTIDDKPALVGPQIVQELRERMSRDQGAIKQACASTVPYRPGETVRIVSGPWTGLLGTFKTQNRGQARIDIDILGGIHTISAPLHILAPLVSGSPAS